MELFETPNPKLLLLMELFDQVGKKSRRSQKVLLIMELFNWHFQKLLLIMELFDNSLLKTASAHGRIVLKRKEDASMPVSKTKEKRMEARPLPGGRVEVRVWWPWYANRCAKLAADPSSGWEDLGSGKDGARAFSAPSEAFSPRRMRKGRPDAQARMRARRSAPDPYPEEIVRQARRMAEPPESTIAAEAALERWVAEMEAETTPKPQPQPAPAPDAPFDPLALVGADKYEEFHGDPEPPEDPDDDLGWI